MKEAETDGGPLSPLADVGSLRRAVLLLKVLATSNARGLALTEIAERTGLPHPSVHRLLRQLSEERLVARHDELKRYRMGPLAYELGIAVTTLYGDLRDVCDDAMCELSEQTGDTAYLVVRSGFDGVCMHRVEGEFPIRALVLDVGGRRPLGVGAGALSLLAHASDDERRMIIDHISPKLSAFRGMTAEMLEVACIETRERGLAVTHDTMSLGVSAVGRAFCDSLGQPVGAISVTALSHRMTSERVRRIGSLLEVACTAVERRLTRHHLKGWRTDW